jgi:phosphatidylserine/phosphatidylglycerophosphate/cardiolipin synthase-like enzyme
VRVYFPPEKKPGRDSVDPIVEAVENARQSVVFCLFSSTDEVLREACFKAGDAGKMMFGIVNLITEPKETAKPTATTKAAVELYHRSREDHDVVGHDSFQKGSQPSGFWWEIKSLNTAVSEAVDLEKPKGKFIPQVFIHHKFVVVDAEAANPVIYTGSANISGNSMWMNDENILEITDCPRLARIYLAEFMRLYEHYRARAAWNRRRAGDKTTFRLDPDTGWAAQAFQPGTPEFKTRVNMVSPLTM